MYRWILANKLAVSRMPYPHEIPELASIFDSVVVLIEPHEYPGSSILEYIRIWRSHGVEVYYCPTRDWWPPELLELLGVVKWIKKRIDLGHKVLVHCMGGIGRSGTVAAAYLVYTMNMKPWDAVSVIRSKIPGALEVYRQERMVYNLYDLLNVLGSYAERLYEYLRNTIKNDKLFKHLSKVTQLTLELSKGIGVSEKSLRELLIASMLHDIVYSLEDKHCISSAVKIINDGVSLGLSSEIYRISSIVRCHHPNICDPSEIDLEKSILILSDHMDHTMDQSVDYLNIEFEDSNTLVIDMCCELDCTANVSSAISVKKYLEDSLGVKVLINRSYSV